jgi:hypothetical protein
MTLLPCIQEFARMVKIIAYTDSRGKLHITAKAATVSDLAELFGSAEGMGIGIANTILEKRSEIEAIFAEYDSCASDS